MSDKLKEAIQAGILDQYSKADQAFYRFWYGHMLGDLMQPPLCSIDHSTARYIWDAALAESCATSLTDDEILTMWHQVQTKEWTHERDEVLCFARAFLSARQSCATSLTDEKIIKIAKSFGPPGAIFASFDEVVIKFARALLSAQQSEQQSDKGHVASGKPEADTSLKPDRYLNEYDFADLFRFNECCEDFESGGHDVPKDRMKRLEELGVVRPLGFGRHEVTSFGSYVIETVFLQNPKLPLKTTEEHNAAAIAATKEQQP